MDLISDKLPSKAWGKHSPRASEREEEAGPGGRTVVETTSRSGLGGGRRLTIQNCFHGNILESTCIHCKPCQDWVLYRCFDSKVELSESEDETTYDQRLEAELDGHGTAQALLLGYVLVGWT